MSRRQQLCQVEWIVGRGLSFQVARSTGDEFLRVDAPTASASELRFVSGSGVRRLRRTVARRAAATG